MCRQAGPRPGGRPSEEHAVSAAAPRGAGLPSSRGMGSWEARGVRRDKRGSTRAPAGSKSPVPRSWRSRGRRRRGAPAGWARVCKGRSRSPLLPRSHRAPPRGSSKATVPSPAFPQLRALPAPGKPARARAPAASVRAGMRARVCPEVSRPVSRPSVGRRGAGRRGVDTTRTPAPASSSLLGPVGAPAGLPVPRAAASRDPFT